MHSNLLLGGDDVLAVADRRRRDLAAQWGRPPVPVSLQPSRLLRRPSPRFLRRLVPGWASGSSHSGGGGPEHRASGPVGSASTC
jgi:hypothetical protein